MILNTHSPKKLFFNSMFYRLECIPLNKFDYQHEITIIYYIAHKSNLSLNIIKKIYKHTEEKKTQITK